MQRLPHQSLKSQGATSSRLRFCKALTTDALLQYHQHDEQYPPDGAGQVILELRASCTNQWQN